MLYLVTKSTMYYPTQGTGDWVEVTTDEDRARAAFAETVKDSEDYEFVFLISIDAEGWKTLDQDEGVS